MRIDYACDECGAQGTTLNQRIYVPHEPGCRIAARLARLRADRCPEPDCDGTALHPPPHYQWVPE